MNALISFGIAIIMMLMNVTKHSFAYECVSCSHNPGVTGKSVQEWFNELGRLSNKVAKSCLDLPQADKVRQLEAELKAVSNRCNTTEKHLQQLKANSESRIDSLEKQVADLATKVNKLITADTVKKIENGVLEKRGTKCHLECNPGSYAKPSGVFNCSAGQFSQQIYPRCIAAKSCKDIVKYVINPSNGMYKIHNSDSTVVYEVYCDMSTDSGGWTLAAVVANSDGDNWVYNDVDKNFGDSNSLWENSGTLGTVADATIRTAKDFKSLAFNDMKGNELLIAFKGKSYIQTINSCIGDKSLKQLFNVLQFSCAGSSYNCYYGKCLGAGALQVSSKCTHECPVAKFYPTSGGVVEPLANNRQPTSVLLKTGEAEGAQDGNKDRVYISTLPYRNNVDYVPGLGSFTSLSGKLNKADIGIHDDVAKQSPNRNLFYALLVR